MAIRTMLRTTMRATISMCGLVCVLIAGSAALAEDPDDAAHAAELKLLRAWFHLEDPAHREAAGKIFRAIYTDGSLPEPLRIRAGIGLARVDEAGGDLALSRQRLEALLTRADKLPGLRRMIVKRLGPPRWFEAVRVLPRAGVRGAWFLDLDSGGMTQSRDQGPRGGPEMEGGSFLVPTRVDNSVVGSVPHMSNKPWNRLRTDEGNLALVQVLSTSPQTVVRFLTRIGGHGDVLPSPREPFCIGYNSKIEVWWRTDPQYETYRVQRRVGPDAPWEEAVERAQPPFIDRGVDVGERYGYRIVGVTRDGYEGLPARMQATVRSRGVVSGRIEIKRNVKCDLMLGDTVAQGWDINVQNIWQQGAMIRNRFGSNVFALIRAPGDKEPLSPWDAQVSGQWQLKSGDEFLVALHGGGVARCRVTITRRVKNQYGAILDYLVYGDADSFPPPPRVETKETDAGVVIEARADEPYRVSEVQVTKLISGRGPMSLPLDGEGRAFDADPARDDVREYTVVGVDAHGRRTLPGRAFVVRLPSKPYAGEFKFHFQQGYSFEQRKVVPFAACDIFFQAANRQIQRIYLMAPQGIGNLRAAYDWKAQKITDRQIFDRVAGAEQQQINLALTQIWCNEKTAGENVLIARTRHGGWVKLHIVDRQNSGNWTQRTATIRFVYNPREPVFDLDPGKLTTHAGVRFSGLEKIEERARVIRDWTNGWNTLSRDRAFRDEMEKGSRAGGHVEDIERSQEVIQSEDAYNNLAKARYSFALARRDPPGGSVHHSVWDFKWRGSEFFVRLSRGDKSTISDLGRLHWVQLREQKQLLVGDTISAEVRFGHVYLVRKTTGGEKNVPSLLRVTGLEPNRRLQFEWVSLQGDELTTSPGLALEDAVRDRFYSLLKHASQGDGAAKNSAANRAYWKLQNARLNSVGRRDARVAKFTEEFALVADLRIVLEGDVGTRTVSVLRPGASAHTVLEDLCDSASLAWRIDDEGRIHLRPRILTDEEKREAAVAAEKRKQREAEAERRRAEEQRKAKLEEFKDVRAALQRAIAALQKK